VYYEAFVLAMKPDDTGKHFNHSADM